MLRLRSIGFGFALFALGCASATDEGPLTWDEFRDQAYQEPDTGVYIINGDEPAETLVQLADAYDRYLDSFALAGPVGAVEQGSIVNLVSGRWDVWPRAQAENLTYCVDKASFGSRYNTVVSAMNSATGAWESAGRLDFVHSSNLDASCDRRTNVVFNVRQICTGRYLARAFFPSSSRSGREILVDCTSFGNIKPWSLTGILRHELGHTIGLRHEHTRPEAGVCYENSSWAALTSYDSASVMHYPQCNGTNNGDLTLTTKDKTGAGILYP
jgi:serralysin